MYSTEFEIDDLLTRFENQTLAHEEWTHSAHLAMAALAVLNHGDQALDYIRTHIKRLNTAQGVVDTPTRGYHETLTVAWIAVVRAELKTISEEDTRQKKVNAVVEAFQDKTILLRYYSRDLIMSLEARHGFVEPDLEPLPH